MSEAREILADSVGRLFGDLTADGMRGAASDDRFAAAWAVVEDMGIPLLFIPEGDGGFGGDWRDAFAVLELLGRHALPLPVAETMLVRSLLHRAGIEAPEGPISIAAAQDVTFEANVLSTHVAAVPWGRACAHLLVGSAGDGRLYLVSSDSAASVLPAGNTAGEPRDTLVFDKAPVLADAASGEVDLFALGALLRTSQMAGALKAALGQSVQYASEREQFGRPLARFQVIQHQLARLAGEAAAVACAAEAACCAQNRGEAGFEIAAAKLRANRAVSPATAIAHQIHGAIGITEEHSLHRWTLRLIAWRSEFGNDHFWARRLGRRAAATGSTAFWSLLTAR
jgi:acyl-CoA dehydrogenase